MLGLVSLAGWARAERLIEIPTGTKIPFGAVRFERVQPLGGGREGESLLGLGIGLSFDTELRLVDRGGGRQIGTFDFAYNYVTPFMGLTPGISFGVQDALSRSERGRRYFAALTYRDPAQAIGGELPLDLTLGFFYGRDRSTPFIGVSMPFAEPMRLLMEHDGLELRAGVELRPLPGLRGRVIFSDRSVLTSLGYMLRF